MSNHKNIKLKKAPELNQKTKDSLQGEAWKYDKAFYSPKYKVNVDPEDGVLENRVFYKDGSELKYESIDKPFDENNSAPTNFSTPFMAKSPLKVDPFAKPKKEKNPPQYHAQKIRSKIAMMPSSTIKSIKKGVQNFVDFYSGAKKKLDTKK